MHKGVYPTSLDQLVTVQSKPEDKQLIDRILHDQWNDRYEYQLGTNGFTIVAVMPSGWFLKMESFKKTYGFGEALKSNSGNQ